MKLPQYVSKDEVKRVCKALGFRDWSAMTKAQVTEREASAILEIVNKKGMKIPLRDFRQGLEVELEHGTRYEDANVANNHPILSGMIVLAHLKETLDYYKRIEVAEIEGDLLQAVMSKDVKKIEEKYRRLIGAQGLLYKSISEQLK